MCGITLAAGKPLMPVVRYLCKRQDERGGDGAGIAYLCGDKLGYIKGFVPEQPTDPIGKEVARRKALLNKQEIIPSLFHLFLNYEIPDSCEVFFGHSRKTTSGANSYENAQPLIRDGIVFVHNGTLYQNEDFKIKYPAAENLNDSNVLAKYLADKNFEILDDYVGSAALIWMYLDDLNHIYAYCGESYGKRERPLHFMQTEDSIYFSSTADPLQHAELMLDGEYKINFLDSNKIFKINIRTLKWEVVKVVDRPQIGQQSTISSNAKSSEIIYLPARAGCVVYRNGRYLNTDGLPLESNFEIVNGKFEVKPVWISPLGVIVNNLGADNKIPAYFYDGILFNSKASLELFLNSLEDSWTAPTLVGLVVNPIPASIKNTLNSNFHYNSESKTRLLNGQRYIPFTNICLHFTQGVLLQISEVPLYEAKVKTTDIMLGLASHIDAEQTLPDKIGSKIDYLNRFLNRCIQEFEQEPIFGLLKNALNESNNN